MDLSNIDLNLLVTLDLLLEERSVRGAARRAGVTPSAMSHSLARLRSLLDDEVLVRAGHGMVATPRAELLAEPVRDLLAQARVVLSEGRPVRAAKLQRAFRLVCTDHVTTVLLPEVERLLAAEAKGVDLYVCPLLPQTMEDLRTGQVDVAVGVFPEAPAEMRTRRLFVDGFVTVARAGHPRRKRPLALEDFLAEGHLLVAPRGKPGGHVDEVLSAKGLRRRVARTTPSFLGAIWHLEHSDYLLTLSRRLVHAVQERIPLTVWPTPVPLEDYTVSLLWHPRIDRDAEHAWFRSVVLRAAARLDG